MYLQAVVALVMVVSSVPAQKQPDYGSVSFEYFDSETRAAAETLQNILISGDSSVFQNLRLMNASNSALTALKTYVDAETSAKGTACYIGGQDEKRFDNTPQEIVRVLRTCDAFVSFTDRETLKNNIVDALKKIQSLDDNLKLNSQICFSLRVPPSQSCVDSEKKARDGVKALVTPSEIAKYQALRDTFVTKAKEFVDSCFTLSTQTLRDQLASWTKQITDCQATLKQ